MLRKLALLAALVSASCLTPMEPTPQSDIVTITPVNASTLGAELPSGSFFRTDILIANKSQRIVYVDANRRFLEKLVDQKWIYAYGDTEGNFIGPTSLSPSGKATFAFSVAMVRNSSPARPLVEHIRGVYRVHYRLAFDRAGTDVMDSATTYSQPFVVQK
jgi:hypothetical protein